MQVVKFILMKAFVILFIPLVFELIIFLISFIRCLSILLILSKYQPGNVFYSSLFSVHWFLFLKISYFLNHLKFGLFFALFLNGRTYIINFIVSCLIQSQRNPSPSKHRIFSVCNSSAPGFHSVLSVESKPHGSASTLNTWAFYCTDIGWAERTFKVFSCLLRLSLFVCLPTPVVYVFSL